MITRVCKVDKVSTLIERGEVSSDKWLTVRQAADMLGVSSGTLRNWDGSGRLRVERNPSNGYRRYAVEDVVRLMQESAQSPDASGNPRGVTESGVSAQPGDTRQLRLLVRQMSRAYRDSLGGGLLERFEEISKLLFCKLYDERSSSGRDGRAFARFPGESDNALFERIQGLYSKAVSLLPEQQENGFSHLTPDTHAVSRIVDMLADVNLLEIPADIKGAVYEELIRNTFDKTDNQQFFTPRTVVDFIVDLARPLSGETVVDPACGSGGFLIAASEHLHETGEVACSRLLGLEIDRRMAWVAQMNLLMHGGGEGSIHYLSGSGSLAKNARVESLLPDGTVDVVITNPPFGSDFNDEDSLQTYELGRGRTSRRRGVLFLERCIDWLRPGGRMAIIIDDGVLNGSGTADVREHILRRCVLRAVVSLPEVAFMPYASVKSSVLLVTKKSSPDDVQGPVFMATSDNVGRRPNGDPLYSDHRDASGQPLLLDDLPGVMSAWTEYVAHGRSGIAELSPKVFECPPEEVELGTDAGVPRLDVQNHHPSRALAETLLGKSPFPVFRLGELVAVRNVSANPSVQDPEDMWRFVGLANIAPTTGYMSAQDTAGSQLKSSVRLFRGGDILFAKLRPELRKCAVVPIEEDEGWATSECLVMRTLLDCAGDPELADKAGADAPASVDREYLAIILRSDICYGQLVFQVTGVGRPRVNASTVLSMRIPVPPIETQREIVAAYAMAQTQHQNAVHRSEEALVEADLTLRNAYSYAVDRLCPS